MNRFEVTWRHIVATTGLLLGLLGMQQVAYAQPFGVGVYGADVPFGDETSISISLSGAANVPLTPSGGTFHGTGSHMVTVTSSDVIGYDLYVHATTATAMSNGVDTIPSSSNTAMGSLTTNSWGYNTTGSTTDFIGMTNTQALIGSGTGPFIGGDSTDVTYGALIDITKSAGVYNVDVTYTAVGRT